MSLDLRQKSYNGHNTYRAQVSAILKAEPGRAYHPAGIALEVGCSYETALRYCQEYRTVRRRPGPLPQRNGRHHCHLCECLESEDEPLGKSGHCVACWWSLVKRWDYYAYRTGEITEEQRAVLAEEFGLDNVC